MAHGPETGAEHPDSGVTLVEVVVAVVVFMLIAAGISAGAVTVIRLSADNRSREVATNLAAQDLDQVRSLGDPFAIPAAPQSQTFAISNRTYTVTQSTSWVSAAGADVACSTGSTLVYRRVDVLVTWTGQLPTTQPVESDTLIAPNGPISSASTGSIGISVTGSTGSGESGVAVTISAVSGGAVTPSTQPSATDANGCSFATNLTPGVYSVALSRAVSLDQSQNTAPSQTTSVAVGSTSAVSFAYDQYGTFPLSYASNYSGSTPLLPTNLTTTFLSTLAPYITATPATSISLYPVGGGYQAIAGTLASTTGTTLCSSFDPAAWPASTSGTPALAAGVRLAGQGAAAGTTSATALGVSMGVVQVTATATGTLTATATDPTSAVAGGNPGCATAPSAYTFGSVLKNGTITIALPYGSWTLSGSTSFKVATLTNATNTSTSTAATSVAVVLDPRAKK